MSASFAELLFLSLSLSPLSPHLRSWGVACKGKMGCILCDLDLVWSGFGVKLKCVINNQCEWTVSLRTRLYNGHKIIDMLWSIRNDLSKDIFRFWIGLSKLLVQFNLKILFSLQSLMFPLPQFHRLQLNRGVIIFNPIVDSSSQLRIPHLSILSWSYHLGRCVVE